MVCLLELSPVLKNKLKTLARLQQEDGELVAGVSLQNEHHQFHRYNGIWLHRGSNEQSWCIVVSESLVKTVIEMSI